jgi:hypothetical protein
VNTDPLLKTPPTVTYVAPPRRTTIQQQTTSEASASMHEKPVEPLAETQNHAAKPTKKSLLMEVPFPERLDKTKEEKQYSKFLETMKEV